MQPVLRALNSVKPSDAPVFIQGETGTGKESIARLVHSESPHAYGPFVVINCAELTLEQLETEYLKSVDANTQDASISGQTTTLYLDQITSCDPTVQLRLLRLVSAESNPELVKRGSPKPKLRFISSCSQDIASLINADQFQAKLYHYLNTVPITLPALRERSTDIIAIASTLIEQLTPNNRSRFHSFSPDAAARLSAHSWPGNLRQLTDVIHHVAQHHDGPHVTEKMLPNDLLAHQYAQQLARNEHQNLAIETLLGRPLAEIERLVIERTIDMQNGSVTRAANVLGVSPSTLYRKRDAWDRE